MSVPIVSLLFFVSHFPTIISELAQKRAKDLASQTLRTRTVSLAACFSLHRNFLCNEKEHTYLTTGMFYIYTFFQTVFF